MSVMQKVRVWTTDCWITVMLVLIVMLFVLFLCSGCATPSEQADFMARLNEDFRAGRITQEQYGELLRAMRAGSATSWLETVGTVAGAAAAALIGVRLHRGPTATPEERVRRRRATRLQHVAAD